MKKVPDRDTMDMDLYRSLYLIRRFEERAAHLRQQGFIPGFLHPYVGQEAVAVGVCAALEQGDVITSTHRGHGHMLARGADPARMYAELYARQDGYNRAKGGSLHMIDVELGFLGANGIVGGGIPLATGAGLQKKREGKGRVAISFFGDGATNEGSFHESLNLAALWSLPVVYVCENNFYGEFTPQHKHQPITNIARRADSYAMAGVVVEGNYVLEVRDVARAAVERARAGKGPTLIEARTYRHRGHYEGDMARYRPAGELEDWMERDPLRVFEQHLGGQGITDSDLEGIRQSVESQLDEAERFAEESPRPRPKEALEDVYVETYQGKALR
jgi:pyruvate dehydrogenase E1 component alpha subunit